MGPEQEQKSFPCEGDDADNSYGAETFIVSYPASFGAETFVGFYPAPYGEPAYSLHSVIV